MKKNYILIIAVWVFLFSGARGYAQENTLHMMPDVFQSTYTNPAFKPYYRFSIGLPLLSSFHGSIGNNGFSTKDFLYFEGASLVLDSEKLSGTLDHRKNYAHMQFGLDLFHLHFRIKRGMVSINVSDQVSGRITYSGDFLNLFLLGNGHEKMVGRPVDLGLGLNTSYFREYGLGINQTFGKLTLGARFKILQGFANISTSRSILNIQTDPNALSVSAEMDYQLNIATPFALGDNPMQGFGQSMESAMANPAEFGVKNFVTSTANLGAGIDLGATFDLTKRFKLSGSLINLGYIRWTSNAKNYSVKYNMNYDGVEFAADGNLSMPNIADSLTSAFNGKGTNENYVTGLSPQMYLTANYELLRGTNLMATLHNEFYLRPRPSLILGASQRLGRLINFVGNISVKQSGLGNIGGGFYFKPGPVQMFMVADHLNFVMGNIDISRVNLRVGMNFVFGNYPKKLKRQKIKLEEQSQPIEVIRMIDSI